MKTIVLGGQLGKLFGRKHRFDVKTAAEAVRALIANFPTVEKYLLDNSDVGYRVKLHGEPLRDAKEMLYPVGGASITITPVIAGSKSALGSILLGVALVAAAFFTGGASIAATGFMNGGIVTTFWGGIAVGLGVSLALGGIAQMLAPQPKTQSPADNPQNTGFDGPRNTTAQGNPVPVGYGRMIVGGAVISAGITTDELSSQWSGTFGSKFEGVISAVIKSQ